MDKILSLFVSWIILLISSGIGILNPQQSLWLSIEDGQSELAWEFFRNRNIFDFPLGLNYQYGMNTASTLVYSDLMPVYAFLLRPFSVLLPDRFQYIGLVILLNIALIFYISNKVFALFITSNKFQILFSIILASSPLTLHRFLDFTHYSLSSNWLILLAIYFYLKKELSFLRWSILILVTPLIHSYYYVTIFPLFILTIVYFTAGIKQKVMELIKTFILLLGQVVTMFSVGFIFEDIETDTAGDFGIFKSNIFSFIDSNDWSHIIPNLSGPGMTYEGFAYLGLVQILIILTTIFLTLRIKIKRLIWSPVENFQPLLILSTLLFIFSLTNVISLGFYEVIIFKIPEEILRYLEIFRSTGRFTWLLGYSLIIWSLINLYRLVKNKNLMFISILILLLISLIDQNEAMTKYRKDRFNKESFQYLQHNIWDLSQGCYKDVIMYPSLPNVDDWYKYALYAQNINMGVSSTHLARADYGFAREFNNNLQFNFRTGNLNNDSIYVFTSKKYFSQEFVDRELNNLLRTIPDGTYHGNIDGHYTFFPNLDECTQVNERTKNLLSKGPLSFESKNTYIFNNKSVDANLLFENWSKPEDWGVWSLTNSSSLFISNNSNSRFLEIKAHTFSSKGEISDLVEVKINGTVIGICEFLTFEYTKCSLEFDNIFESNLLYIQFELNESESPLKMNISEDPRNLGIALSSISLIS